MNDDDDDDAPLIVPAALDGSRADRAVAAVLDVPVNAARRLMEAGRVRVGGKRVRKGDAVAGGAPIVVEGGGAWLVPGPGTALVPALYEDSELVVVDKPAGMPCHPLVPGEGGTVVDAVVARYPEIAKVGDAREAGLVHRLDTGTSGCLTIARTVSAWMSLRAAFSSDVVEKRYLALVAGRVDAPIAIDDPIGHDPADARRMRIDPNGRAASTSVEPLASSAQASVVVVVLQGGRRHQIRVHLGAIGHAIVGDTLYGAGADGAWPWLHAASLKMPGKPVVRAPVPTPFVEAATQRGLHLPASGI